MTCSKDFGRRLQTGCLGLIGMLAIAAGCGGSEGPSKKYDGGSEVGGQGGGAAALNVTPNAVNLGILDVKGSGMATVVVSNTGKQPSGTIAVAPSAGITATGCAAALQPNTSCTLTIVVAPTTVGAFTGQVSITANPGAISPLVVSVIAQVSPKGMFSVTPTTLPLGNVAVGVAAPRQTVTVTAAVAITDLSYATSGPDVAIDKAASTCTAALAAGASCVVAVNFLATTAGQKEEYLVISAGGATAQPTSIPITANAQNPPRLVISPATPQTLTTAAGTPSSAIPFLVQNTGDVPTGTISATLTGANASSFTVTSNCLVLAALANCNVSVVYKPAAGAKAAEAATLVVADTTAGGSTVQVALTGTPFPPTDLVITSTTTDLGSVLVNTTGAATVFTVTNQGDTTSGAMTATVSSPEFVIINDTCSGGTLAKGATCTVSVALKPGTPGGKSATLQVAAVGANAAVKTITGTGVTGVILTVSPTALDFGTVRVNKTGTAQTVTVKNAGGTTSGTLSFTKSGNFAVFPITANGCSAALPPNGTCTFTVNFTPTEAKSELAGYTVSDGTVSANVSLSGTGLPQSGISISPSPVGACAEPTLQMPSAFATSSQCFATTVIGGTSPTIAFTVTASDPLPAGIGDTGPLTVALNPATPADFTVVQNGCTTPLLAGASCQVTVVFTPTATGLRQAALNVTTANGGSDSATLQGTGLSVIEIRPLDTTDPLDPTKKLSGLDFGQVPLLGDVDDRDHEYMVIVRGPNTETTYTSQVLTTLTDPSQPADFMYPDGLINPCNTGSNGAVTLDFKASAATPTMAQPSDWYYVSGAKVFICTFWVQFYPQSSKGNKTATLTATGSGPVTDSKTLTGAATGVLTFDYTGEPDFGTTWQVGESSNTQATTTVVSLSPVDELVTLKNHSTTTDLGPATLTMSGDVEHFIIVRDFCTGLTLTHGGGECEVGVAFRPTSAGQKTGILTANVGAETASVTFTGGASDPFDITITPDQYVFANDNRHDFGTVAQGSPSTWHAFTITNPAGSARSAQVTYTLSTSSTAVTPPNTGLTLANGNNHEFGSCGNTGTTTLAPGTNCTLWVQFRPLETDVAGTTLNTGIIRATDQAKGKSVEVRTKGKVGSVVSIAPASYTFPDTAGGLTSTATNLTVTNNGNAQITLSIPANTALAPFSVDQSTGCAVGARTLAAGATCVLSVTFIGSSGTTSSVVAEKDLVVGAAGYASATGTTALKGTSVMPAKLEAVGFDNASTTPFYQIINLGGVRVGYSSADVTLTFKNTGSAATSSLNYAWEGLAANTPDSEFIIVNEAAEGCVGKTSLAAGATCKVTVHFTPSSTGAAGIRGPKSFALSATTGDVVQVFKFQAYALNPSASGWIGISGGALGFFTFPGSTPNGVGASFPRQVFQLTNGTATNITNLALTPSGDATSFTLITSGDDAGSVPCTATLNASSSCTFGVGFIPTAWAETQAYRHAAITANIGTGVVLGVFGRVRSPAVLGISPVSTAVPNPYAFGEVVLGSNPSKAFTITNLGETASTALAIATTTTGPAGAGSQFGHSGACEGATLAAGASCVGSVTFTPGTTAANNWAGTLTATVTGSSKSVTLSAASVHNTLLAVNVASLTFPPTSVGTASANQAVTLSNAPGSQTSGLLTIGLADATNFSIVSTVGCPLASDPDADLGLGDAGVVGPCVVTLAFVPRTLGTGTFSTTLTMAASPGNTQTVTLSGTAVSALKTIPPTSIINAISTSLTSPIAVTVYLEPGAPDTGMLSTSITGGNYRIIEDQCVATKLAPGDSCVIKLVFLGTAATPNKQGTLTINGGSGGATASVVLNSSTPPTQ